MDGKTRERDVLWVFDIALVLKAINGALEVIGAAFILLVRPGFVLRIADLVTGGELSSDPNDFVAQAIRNAAHSFAVHTHYFIALYLAVHGFVKLVLVAGIFAGKRIAYPIFMVALGIFGAYEVYRGVARSEFLLFALALFDFTLILLTAHEYRRRYGATLRPGTDPRA